MASKSIAKVHQTACVACGVCENGCPKKAITIIRGMYAYVHEDKCIGCRKCMNICPANVIFMKERDIANE